LWQQRAVCRRTAEAVVQRQGLDRLLVDVLIGRGVGEDELAGYLKPSLREQLPDPYVLTEMDKAAGRLADAVTGGETVGIFGDYDVDGTTAAALLYRYLKAVGANVVVHLPDRFTEGYGPSREGFRSLEEQGASVIVTVDCGSNHAGVVEASSADVVILDHHLMSARPDVFALVNPQRPGDASGLVGLSAGGVTFMTLVALNRLLREKGLFEARAEPRLLQSLDLVALSLIADVMPLRGLTRTLVAQGLRVLGQFGDAGTGNPGLRALASVAGLQGTAQASHLGFQIGPRINAAGRIGHAKTAFDLLTTDDPARAVLIAQKLEALNRERKRLEEEVRRQAFEQAEAMGASGGSAIVTVGEGWHPGVVGIVAGRLKERFNRPAFCIALGEGKGTGSGRSVAGVDLGSAVSAAAAAGVIDGGGGHAMAAGLSLREGQLEDFRAFLDEELGSAVAAATETHPLVLDGVVGLGAVHAQTCRHLAPAGPYGAGNPEPRFAMEAVKLRHVRIVGERHLSVTIEDRMGKTARAIAFGCVGEPLGDLLETAGERRVHLAGRITPDTWRGGDAAQIEIDDAAEVSFDPSEIEKRA
jgi:single-stranded-DNA-specific exonuclease